MSGDGFLPNSPVVLVSDRNWFDPVSTQADSAGSINAEVLAPSHGDQGRVTAVGISEEEAFPQDSGTSKAGGYDAPMYDGAGPENEDAPDFVPLEQRHLVLSADVVVKPQASRIPVLAAATAALIALLLALGYAVVRRRWLESDGAADVE